MKVCAQIIERQIEEFNKKRLNGTIDFPLFFSAFAKVLSIKNQRIGDEDLREINTLWYNYRWGSWNNILKLYPRPKSESQEEKEIYLKKVRSLHNDSVNRIELKLNKFIERFYPHINRFLEPYKEIEKTDLIEETGDYDVWAIVE